MPDIHHAITVDAAPNAIMPLVATADGFMRWWAEDVGVNPDRTVSLGFFNRATIYRLRLVEQTASRAVWRCETGQEWEGTDCASPGRAVNCVGPRGASSAPCEGGRSHNARFCQPRGCSSVLSSTVGHEIGHGIHVNHRDAPSTVNDCKDSQNPGGGDSLMNSDWHNGNGASSASSKYSERDVRQMRLHDNTPP
jgi:hypothetical protein